MVLGSRIVLLGKNVQKYEFCKPRNLKKLPNTVRTHENYFGYLLLTSNRCRKKTNHDQMLSKNFLELSGLDPALKDGKVFFEGQAWARLGIS